MLGKAIYYKGISVNEHIISMFIFLMYVLPNYSGSGYQDIKKEDVILRPLDDIEASNATLLENRSNTLDMKNFIYENSQFSIMKDMCYFSSKSYGEWNGDISEVPSQVSLRVKHSRLLYSSDCSGSLITLRYVVTAARCFINSSYPLSDWRIVAGSNNGSGSEGDTHLEIWRRILCYYIREPKRLLKYDIAILEAEKPFQLTAKMQPIRFHTPDMTFIQLEPEIMCLVTGFEKSQIAESSTSKLRIACIPIISFRQCSYYYQSQDIPPNTICAGDLRDTDTCFGNSGSPLICRGVLVGILSQGYDCVNQPGVFTKILDYTSLQRTDLMKRIQLVQNDCVTRMKMCRVTLVLASLVIIVV